MPQMMPMVKLAVAAPSASPARPAERVWPGGRLAFTLVELLVIVAVIALLLAILAPSAQRVVRLAHAVTCASNLHQLGNAAHCYARDNHDYLPRDIWPDQTGHYIFAARFLPYLNATSLPAGNSDSDYSAVYEAIKTVHIYRCPAVRKPDYVLHYVVNGCDFARYQKGEGYQSSPTVQTTKLPVSLSETLYLTEFNPDYPGQTPTGFGVYDVWVPGHMPFNLLAVNASPRMIHAEDDRHGGNTTVAYFDGHAQGKALDPYDVPVSLLNPLDTTRDP